MVYDNIFNKKKIMEEKDNSISTKTKQGMSLTVDDQKWIKVILDRQQDSWNEAFDINIEQITKALAEVIHESHSRMFSLLEEQAKLIKKIQSDIGEIKQSIKELNLEIKDIRIEIRALKVDVKSITLDVENLTKRVTEHDFRIMHIENKVGIPNESK